MSDDDPTEGPIDDPKVTQARHRCLVLGLLFVAACAIVAVVLPLVLDDCDCNISLSTRAPTPVTPTAPTTPSPVAPTEPGASPAPTGVPTKSPAPTNAPTSKRLGQFIDVFLVPLSGEEVFEDSGSPQYRAAEFLSDIDNIAADFDTTEKLQERYALATFYYAMDGDDSWFSCNQADTNCTTGNSWMDPNVDHCDWSAIRCNDDGRVVDVFFCKFWGSIYRHALQSKHTNIFVHLLAQPPPTEMASSVPFPMNSLS